MANLICVDGIAAPELSVPLTILPLASRVKLLLSSNLYKVPSCVIVLEVTALKIPPVAAPVMGSVPVIKATVAPAAAPPAALAVTAPAP